MKMPYRLFFLLLSLLGALLMLPKRGATASPPDATTIDRFLVEQMAAQRIPGLALALIEGDQVRYVKGYGTAGSKGAITPQTQFHVASLSKSFTAVAIMQLVEGGQIDLDAPAQRYLPEFTLTDPAAAAAITVRQLLNQTSGLADAGVPDLRLPRPATSVERIATLRAAYLVATPGREFHYTDVNYQILARIVEVVSGQPFSAYLQAHLFTPLQMTQTVNALTSFEVAQTAKNLAGGHLLAFGLPIASGEERGYLGGSSGVITTAADMAHYLILHNNNGRFQGQTILTPASMAVLHTPPSTLPSDYAMGWFAHSVNGRRVLEHNGILSTFYAEMVLLPESGQGFVLLYNIHSLAQDAFGFPQLKNGLIALLTGGPPTTSGFSVSLWSVIIGIITAISVVLEMRGLWRLPRWRQGARTKPWWRHLLGLVWSFIPAVFLLTLPTIVLATSGRAFGYLTLLRSMLDLLIWLGLVAGLGAINGIVRLWWLLRPSTPAAQRP